MDTRFEPIDVELRGGRLVHVRAVLPTDEEEILQAFDRLSPGARYMRFMGSVRTLNVERLRTALTSFPQRGMAIAATVPSVDGVDIVAAASFMLGEQPGTCEFAISVVDDWAGAGLGSAMLGALIRAARRRGLAEMHGDVLAENGAMLKLAEKLGFSIAAQPGDFSMRTCRLQLDAAAPRE